MSKHSERLSLLLKSPSQLRIALDWLDREGHDETLPAAASTVAFDSRTSAVNAGELAAWFLEWLSAEQVRNLEKVLRLAANHQRVYKRTVALSPRAHLLVKTLAEESGLRISDVIECHLDGALRQQFGLTVRTLIDIHTGEVHHDVISLPVQSD